MKGRKSPVKAVIFDLDGLLVDSEPVWFKVRTGMFRRFGLVWTDDDQKALMGRNTRSWIDYVEVKLDGKLSREEIVRETLEGMVRGYRTHEVRIMPGAQDALDYSSERYAIGLASGSPLILIEAALKSNDWTDRFAEVLSSDDVPHGKPAPDVYLEVMKRLGVSPAESVVVEDSGSGILAGKAAGASVVAVPNVNLMPPKDILNAADIVIGSLAALPAAMENLITQVSN
ncbi:MAG TPA: HAD family phosphatase [Bacteroidota bacterium]|nr:HAD family phosphatase [Bacteroidota bacterium]